MLVNHSMQMLGQIAYRTCNRISRNTFTFIRQKQQLRSKCQQQYRPKQQQQYQQSQLQQQQQQQQRQLSENCQTSLLMSAMKSNLKPNSFKGSVCLVLLPFSAVSCTATLNASTAQNVSFSTSASTLKTNNPEHSPESSDMSSEEFKNAKSIYDFTVKDTHGNDVSLEKFKGNVVLVVNIASQCGLTKNNYKQLTELKEKYHDQGLRILNFPCNQFNSQMPEADGEAMVCHLRDAKADIGELFQKVDVNGANAAPLYQYLKAKQSGTLGSAIKWNFTKFLVNKEGIPVNRYAPTTEPHSIVKDIEKLL